jgi:hypothetical protein
VPAVLVMPTDRPVPSEVVASYAAVYGRGLTDGTVCGQIVLGDTYADVARNLCVTYAMDMPGATHIMWFDSDQVMPSDTVARLMTHRQRIVGGLYHQRVPPFRPVAYDFLDDTGYGMNMLVLPDDPTGMWHVDGLGCTLVELSVYHELAEAMGNPNWHQLSPGHGEDVYFFRRVAQLKVDVWLDADVRAGHLRREVVTTTHYESFRKVHPEQPVPS